MCMMKVVLIKRLWYTSTRASVGTERERDGTNTLIHLFAGKSTAGRLVDFLEDYFNSLVHGLKKGETPQRNEEMDAAVDPPDTMEIAG